MWLRRASASLERGLYMRAAEPIGLDREGELVCLPFPIVVLGLVADRGGWILTYLPLTPVARHASGSVNSRITPVAS